MVDAQANGLAGMIRRVPEVLASGPGWETRAADWLGRLHLLLAAGERAAELPEDLGQTVRTALGFTTPAARVLSTEPVSDRWVVLGQAFEDEDKLRARRTWLIGRATGRRALLLDFAPGGRPFDVSPVPGTEFDGALCFYPGRLALRAVIHEQGEASAYLGRVDRADSGVKDVLSRHAEAMALDPWLRQWPMYIEGLCAARSGDRWFVSDPSGCSLPLRPSFRSSHAFWKWLSVTGGASIGTLFEWDGASATPLAVRDHSGHVDLTTGWAT